MHKVSDLNKKWWYRLIKVTLALVFGVILIVGSFIIYISKQPHNVDNYKVTCTSDDSNKTEFWTNQEGIYVSYVEHNFKSVTGTSLSDYSESLINQKCGLSDVDAEENTQKTLEIILDLNGKYKNYSDTEREALLRKYSSFKIEKHQSIKGSYMSVVLFLSLYTASLILFMEFLKRIFYYIVLGNFFPQSK